MDLNRPTDSGLLCYPLSFSFTQFKYDYSLFIRKTENSLIVLLAYVDDILLVGNFLQ